LVRKLKSKTGGQGNILKQAQEMQARMIAVQEELKNKTVEASVGGGAVLVKVNGQKEVLSVNLSNDIVKEAQEDKEMLEDLILSAVSEAMRQAEELAEKEMGSVTGGINIPGLI
jgi:DNA-binding YbaB/EbfC family protein